MSAWRATLLTATIVLLARPTEARSLSYTVPVESTMSRLARDLYGRASAAPVLATANRLEEGKAVAAGTVLRVPVSFRTTVRRSSPLSTLARTHLKRKTRGPLLAAINGLPGDKAVAAGTALTVPALIWHTAQKSDNLRTLSKTYYRNTDGRFLLRKINGDRKTNAVEAGEKILVPVFASWSDEEAVRTRLNALRAPAGAPDEGSAATESSAVEATDAGTGSTTDGGVVPAQLQDPLQAYAQALQSPLLRDGVALHRRGDFLACVAYFRRALLDPGLPTWPRVAAQVWLASCYVASDEIERAEEAMRAALGARPDLQLDPADTSPKVMQVLERARSQRTP
ncbi:MAG: hypothetical protein ABIJ09_07005 [Pseudomonadota bacterium]